MEALTSRRPQGTRVGHTNSFRRRITRLGRSRSSASAQRHLTCATEHERALTNRELALRAVAIVGADRQRPELPTTEAPRAGSSSGEPVLPCRGRLARRGHHLASRPALGCATRRSDEPCGRSLIARTASGSATRCGSTWSASFARRWPFRSQDGAASLELIQQQQVTLLVNAGLSCVDEEDHGTGRQLESERKRAVSHVARDAGRMPWSALPAHLSDRFGTLARPSGGRPAHIPSPVP